MERHSVVFFKNNKNILSDKNKRTIFIHYLFVYTSAIINKTNAVIIDSSDIKERVQRNIKQITQKRDESDVMIFRWNRFPLSNRLTRQFLESKVTGRRRETLLIPSDR